jgi:hypothetical protein
VPSPAYCDAPGCGAAIAIITVTKAKGGTSRMPVDAAPDPAGNIAVRTVDGLRTGRVATTARPVRDGEVAYMPHFATCTNPKQFRRRESLAERQRRRSEEIAVPDPQPEPQPDLFTTIQTGGSHA